MTLLAGLLFVSSCASKKDLEDCRQNNLKLLESGKEMMINYQQTKEQLAAANARVHPPEATPSCSFRQMFREDIYRHTWIRTPELSGRRICRQDL